MAAPAHTTRVAPTGYKMPDGYKTTVALAVQPGINLWERSVKPIGWDGGEPIETTTMHNVKYRTKDAPHLITIEVFSFKFGYDPDVISLFPTIINNNGSMTTWFPDSSSLDFYAFMTKIEFDDLEEKKWPEGSATLAPTNWDPTAFTEQGPVLNQATGT